MGFSCQPDLDCASRVVQSADSNPARRSGSIIGVAGQGRKLHGATALMVFAVSSICSASFAAVPIVTLVPSAEDVILAVICIPSSYSP